MVKEAELSLRHETEQVWAAAGPRTATKKLRVSLAALDFPGDEEMLFLRLQ